MKELELNKISQFVKNFANIAKRQKWTSIYDPEDDSLAFHKPKLSNDARKKYINDEFALYIDSKNNIQGLFIEYFASNFIIHHQTIQKVIKAKDLKPKKEELIGFEKEKANLVAEELRIALISSLIQNSNKVKSK